MSWMNQAARWLRAKAEAQAETNKAYPNHAKAYPSWVDRIDQANQLANELDFLAQNESAERNGAITWRPMSEHPSPPAATALIRCTDDVDGAHLMPGPVMWSRRDECWVDEGDGEPVLMGDLGAVYEWCYERDIVGAGGTAAHDLADAFPQAHRLALELECLLLGTKDTAAVSAWWDSATDALDQWREFCRVSAAAEAGS